MLYSFELISHSDRTLRTHLEGCNAISAKILAMKFIANTFFEPSLLEKMRHTLVYFHDFGKATDFFQFRIIKAIEKESKNPTFKQDVADYIRFFNETKRQELMDLFKKRAVQEQPLTQHAKLGSYFALTCFKNEDIILELIVLKIIRRHHGYLTNFFKSAANSTPQIELSNAGELDILDRQVDALAFEAYQNILPPPFKVQKADWTALKKRFSKDFDAFHIKKLLKAKRDIRYFFVQHYLFSLLLSADKGDMMLDSAVLIKENQLLPLELISSHKAEIFKDETPKPIDNQRNAAYQDIDKNAHLYSEKSFFSITLPTGLGKTFAAYNAAIILQHAFARQTNGVVPRVVYTLPFTSVIDQNGAILETIFTNNAKTNVSWLTKNHYLSKYNDHFDEYELKNDESEYLTDGWEHDVIVTTFVQFLESIFTNKNRALRKFHNMTNAVFILDEVQAIPPKYYKAIELVMRQMAIFFNTKFIFVTATQPLFFKNNADIIELTDPTLHATRHYFEALNRIEIDQSLLKTSNYSAMEAGDFLEILIQDIDNQLDKSFLIIVNTIAQSQWLYKKLADCLDMDKHELLYLSSSILPFSRLKVIELIKTPTVEKRKIVVSTQVVEAGVDIDLDIVYRDFAPIDSLNQSAGRCNRNHLKGRGTVKLFHLGKSQYIYDKLLMDITKQILENYNVIIAENQLFNLNLAYSKAVRASITEKIADSDQLIEAMYQLDLEDIENKFKLIKEDCRHHDVFIPCNAEAQKTWATYKACGKIEDAFERKRAVKKIKPDLLKYVTRFPKKDYTPPKEQADAFLIYEANWDTYYNLTLGFTTNIPNFI
jgi:CRISPR-associated endonuclease/helicase Cas3